MIKVGIYGVTGYMGSEALRILLQHPQVEVVWATSRNGEEALNYHKNFYKRDIKFTKPEEVSGKDCDVVFFSTPTGIAAEMGSKFLQEGCRIIDFGAVFRWFRSYNLTTYFIVLGSAFRDGMLHVLIYL